MENPKDLAEQLTLNTPLSVTDAVAELSEALGKSDDEVLASFPHLKLPKFQNHTVLISADELNQVRVAIWDMNTEEEKAAYTIDVHGQIWW